MVLSDASCFDSFLIFIHSLTTPPFPFPGMAIGVVRFWAILIPRFLMLQERIFIYSIGARCMVEASLWRQRGDLWQTCWRGNTWNRRCLERRSFWLLAFFYFYIFNLHDGPWGLMIFRLGEWRLLRRNIARTRAFFTYWDSVLLFFPFHFLLLLCELSLHDWRLGSKDGKRGWMDGLGGGTWDKLGEATRREKKGKLILKRGNVFLLLTMLPHGNLFYFSWDGLDR